MNPQKDLLRLLATTPLADRLEMVSLSGWSRGAVYKAVAALEEEGLVESVPHASELVVPTRRYCLTAEGVRRLAAEEGIGVDELMRERPVSRRWRRILLERLDAVAVIYRLASALAGVAFPLRFRWYRAMPMDAAVALPDGRTLAIVRQGLTSDRTGFGKRIWRLREGPQPAAALLLMPDEVRLRHARGLLVGASFISFFALERDVAVAGSRARIWRTTSGATPLGLGEALSYVRTGGAWPVERPLAWRSLPGPLPAGDGAERDERMLLALLKPIEKRALDLVSDWPWITSPHLGALLGVKRSRLSEVLQRLGELGLVLDDVVGGQRRVAVTDRGLAFLSHRDRTSPGVARRRWSVAPLDPNEPLGWRNVSGRNSRQLLRTTEHTDAVHGFLATLATQAREQSVEVVQLDPPRRASRYFQHDGRLHSVQPDAFGALRRGGDVWPFFLEWERRAVRPVTMAARLAPYLRYYATRRPTDDHGAQPVVLVVFDDELAANHFLRVARGEMGTGRVEVPLWVTYGRVLEQEGALGQAWLRGVGGPADTLTTTVLPCRA
ncbi:MAG: replication-relaxation family protein [Chloroflexota bacterium]|nr:replication-relaxation family protein [Chloroflexota bacterium]